MTSLYITELPNDAEQFQSVASPSISRPTALSLLLFISEV